MIVFERVMDLQGIAFSVLPPLPLSLFLQLSYLCRLYLLLLLPCFHFSSIHQYLSPLPLLLLFCIKSPDCRVGQSTIRLSQGLQIINIHCYKNLSSLGICMHGTFFMGNHVSYRTDLSGAHLNRVYGRFQ